ncbi:MAG: hypothetical protein IPM85_05750 [Chitinophagaceae bacterium]|nr:hypothetical protein [Chitinophagaceae bacterium]
MARSHHRKAHKQRLKDYKHVHEDLAHVRQKTGTTFVFTLLGIVLGGTVGYIATGGALLWIAAGIVVMGFAGYLLGKRVEKA